MKKDLATALSRAITFSTHRLSDRIMLECIYHCFTSILYTSVGMKDHSFLELTVSCSFIQCLNHRFLSSHWFADAPSDNISVKKDRSPLSGIEIHPLLVSKWCQKHISLPVKKKKTLYSVHSQPQVLYEMNRLLVCIIRYWKTGLLQLFRQTRASITSFS